MQPMNRYDPRERQREKQRAREQDDRDLRSGAVSADELGRRNGLFSPLDLSAARIRSRGRILV